MISSHVGAVKIELSAEESARKPIVLSLGGAGYGFTVAEAHRLSSLLADYAHFAQARLENLQLDNAMRVERETGR